MISAAFKVAGHSSFMRHKLGAVIVRGHRVLSSGFNSIRYSKEIGKSTLHAEEAAIIKMLKTRRQHLLAGADIYVTRILPSGRCGLSKPCPRCMELISSVGINRIYYTNDAGAVESIKC